MKLKIGENVKALRKSKDITQEEFAEMLGVSCQSVSRWELGICYPDMELLPQIAEIFNISVGALLGVDDAAEKEKVDAYLERFQASISQGDIKSCIELARAGVKEYPNNYALLNKLMYALFLSGDSDGNIPEWKENMQKCDREITKLGERIMKYCDDQNIRLEATSRLAFNHCEMGRKEIGRAIYETLPSVEYCKESQIQWGLREEEKLPHDRELIEKGYEMLRGGFYSLIRGRRLPDEQLIKAFDKVFSLKELIYDGAAPSGDWGTANNHCELAKIYARTNQCGKAFDELKEAVQSAKDFDDRPKYLSVNCLLLGEQTWKKTDFETSDSRSLCEIMRDKWFSDADFDSIRETDEFKAVSASFD